MSFKDTDGERLMHSKSDYIEIMVNDKNMKLLKNCLNHFFLVIRSVLKQKLKVAVLSLIMLIYYIINVVK